ncbi:MAG: DUF2157 domain-containing protein [Phycisphaerae bacterium]|jgi:uncharacterized membrane protein
MACQNEKIQWLHSQIQDWVRLGIIDAACGESIGNLYPPQKPSRSWAMLIFSGLGAVIIGLGVILLFAYNWDKMGKFAKLGVVFGSLILTYLIGISLFVRSQQFKGIGEALCLLGTMLFGAGIWLVAQIYHIEEHFPNAFLFWGIGAFLMAWAMPSVIQASLAAVLFALFAIMEGSEFRTAVPYVFIFLLLLLPLAYKKQSWFLLAVILLSAACSILFMVVSFHHSAMIVFYSLLCIFTLYIAVGLLHQKNAKFEKFSTVYCFIGMAGYLLMLFILSFDEVSREILDHPLSLKIDVVFYWLTPFVFSIVLWLGVIREVFKKTLVKYYSHDLLLMPILLVFLCSYSLSITRCFDWPVIAAFNLIFLIHCLMMMAKGCMDVKLSRVIVGSLLLAALVVARFFDFFESLAVRGAVFVVVGVLIFSQGFFYIKSKKKKALQENKCENS